MGNRISKNDIIKDVALATNTSQAQTKEILNAILDTIEKNVAAGNEVQFVGFGTFSLRHVNAYTGINPRTKEKITVEAKEKPAFKAGTAFKTACIEASKTKKKGSAKKSSSTKKSTTSAKKVTKAKK